MIAAASCSIRATLVGLTSVSRDECADAARACQFGDGHRRGAQPGIERASGLRRARARISNLYLVRWQVDRETASGREAAESVTSDSGFPDECRASQGTARVGLCSQGVTGTRCPRLARGQGNSWRPVLPSWRVKSPPGAIF